MTKHSCNVSRNATQPASHVMSSHVTHNICTIMPFQSAHPACMSFGGALEEGTPRVCYSDAAGGQGGAGGEFSISDLALQETRIRATHVSLAGQPLRPRLKKVSDATPWHNQDPLFTRAHCTCIASFVTVHVCVPETGQRRKWYLKRLLCPFLPSLFSCVRPALCVDRSASPPGCAYEC